MCPKCGSNLINDGMCIKCGWVWTPVIVYKEFSWHNKDANAHMKQLWRKASQKYRDKKTGVKKERVYSGKGEQGDYSHLDGNYIY